MRDLHADLTALAGEIEDPRFQRPGMQRRRNWATRIHRALAAHTPPSEPAIEGCGECQTTRPCKNADVVGSIWCARIDTHTPPSEPVAEPSHQQRADHFQHLYEQASEGRCGPSGLTIGACKASICDCFEFPWVKPAPDEHPDPAPPSSSDADRDTGLSEDERTVNVALSVWSNTCNANCVEEDRVHAAECLLAAGLHRALAARSSRPVGVERIEYVVDWIRNGPHPTHWTGQQSTFETVEKARDFATWSHVHNPRITRRTTVTKVEPVDTDGRR